MRVVLIQYISFFVRGGTFGQRYEGRNQVREDNDWDCVITAQQQSGRQMLEMARKDPPQRLGEGLWHSYGLFWTPSVNCKLINSVMPPSL